MRGTVKTSQNIKTLLKLQLRRLLNETCDEEAKRRELKSVELCYSTKDISNLN